MKNLDPCITEKTVSARVLLILKPDLFCLLVIILISGFQLSISLLLLITDLVICLV